MRAFHYADEDVGAPRGHWVLIARPAGGTQFKLTADTVKHFVSCFGSFLLMAKSFSR